MREKLVPKLDGVKPSMNDKTYILLLKIVILILKDAG